MAPCDTTVGSTPPGLVPDASLGGPIPSHSIHARTRRHGLNASPPPVDMRPASAAHVDLSRPTRILKHKKPACGGELVLSNTFDGAPDISAYLRLPSSGSTPAARACASAASAMTRSDNSRF